MGFRFERLLVWPKALEFVDNVVSTSLKWPVALQSSLGDQVRRAGVSIITNIAEASGKRTGVSRRSFYDHARGSTYEVIGVMALTKKRQLINDTSYQAFYQAGDEIAAMLWGLMEAEVRGENMRGEKGGDRGEKWEERKGYRLGEELAEYNAEFEDDYEEQWEIEKGSKGQDLDGN